ncbi:MAG: glucose-6-phosphate isomerase [Verrucomicrobiota bacterium]
MTDSNNTWNRYQELLIRYPDLGFSLDVSRMSFSDHFLERIAKPVEKAFADMRELEAGAIANPDENRMVGHYWLRNPGLAPDDTIREEITAGLDAAKAFAKAIHHNDIITPDGSPFSDLLLIGIGGSALGPQLVADALVDIDAPLKIHFFDNTDPDGIDRVLDQIGHRLGNTLSVVISKSGGTKETRNGMLEAAHAYERNGLDFAKFAVAVTGPGSQLDELAKEQKWLKRFPMADWIGGRTSVMSTVGLVPMTLLGVDVDAFLEGAAAMDEKTRSLPTTENAAMMLALMWHFAGNGRGEKDMVVIPYKDRLVLLSKYLQQLVMESLGKELDLDGNTVHQGLAVYGNKGSTDQHAYIQQLRDGVPNFFATFLEVRKTRASASITVEKSGVNTGDFLQGFLRGTRSALAGNNRDSITITVDDVDAKSLGALIALFERAVTFYASLVNINAYHQPGVEAGKKAATAFLDLLVEVQRALTHTPQTADTIADTLEANPEDVYHCLAHLAANTTTITHTLSDSPATDTFTLS